MDERQTLKPTQQHIRRRRISSRPSSRSIPLEVVSAEGVWLMNARLASACSISMAATRSRRSATAIPRWTRARRRAGAALQLPEQRRAAWTCARARPQRLVRVRAAADFDRVFFVNSGAEANENALKMAFTHHRAHRSRRVEHSFHGRTAARRRAHLGRRAEVVRLPAHAVRRELHAAARCRGARAAHHREDRGRDHRARAGPRRRVRLRRGVSRSRCASAATKPARC